jgi:hypothetical protein
MASDQLAAGQPKFQSAANDRDASTPAIQSAKKPYSAAAKPLLPD